MSFLSVLVALLVLFPGLLTVMNRPKETENRLFLGLSASLSLWVLTNFLVDAFSSTALLFTRLTFLTIVFGAVFFWDFTHYFPIHSKHHLPRAVAYVAMLVMAIVVWLPSFVPSVTNDGTTSNVVTGPLYPVFLVYFVGFIILAIRRLSYSVRHSTGTIRQRARMVLLAIGLMTVWGTVTNLLLPLYLGNNKLAGVGTFSTLIFTGLIGYSMLKLHLFDIRAAITRAAAYVMTLGVLTLIYTGLVYALTAIFDSTSSFTTGTGRVAYVAFALFAAVFFQPLKRLFDKITNAAFYRDAYDPQALLDKLNDLLVRTIDLENLLISSSALIGQTIKSSYCVFVIASHNESDDVRIFGGAQQQKHADLKQAGKAALLSDQALLVTEEVEDRALRHALKDAGVIVGKRMSTTTSQIGYIFLGEKKNGNIYVKKDIDVVDLIADELALAIENALRFEQIRDFNATLQHEVDQATGELRRNNDKLKALDEAKDEFISMASHQLRTPLTSIKGYLSLVLEGDVGDISPQQREMLSQAFTSSQRMVYLISDLLNVSRLRTGKFLIEPKPTYLPDVISEELQQVFETAKARKVKINYEKPKEFPTVNIDDTKIRQVIMNFVDNAIYYTPAGGVIKVLLEKKSNNIEFTVVDNGIGVPKSEQHKLFTKFYRAGNARKARPDGTGLGLFMAKKVIVASGGALIFKTAEGKGSTFGFTFPLAPTQQPKE